MLVNPRPLSLPGGHLSGVTGRIALGLTFSRFSEYILVILQAAEH